MRRAAAAVALAASLSSGCASAATPGQVLAERVDAATVAANERDADGLREAAQELADTISAQRDAQELPAARAEQLLSLATTLREQADVIDPDVQARLQAEQDAEEAREEAAAERVAREQAEREAEREASEAEQQREREATERAAREQAERKAAEAEQAARKAAEAEQAAREAERAAAEESARAEQGEDGDKGKGKGKGGGSKGEPDEGETERD